MASDSPSARPLDRLPLDRLPLDRLLAIMARLRDPVNGCPWDVEQSFRTVAPHTIEEAYEVADAIERDDMPELRDELGDLLFQVVFLAQLASEQGQFNFADVAAGISDKLVRRHPHVFGKVKVKDSEEIIKNWNEIKKLEKKGLIKDKKTKKATV